MSENKNMGMNLNLKSFINAIIVVFVLMIVTYVLTFFIPAGTYERVIEDGQSVVVANSYTETTGSISFVKFILSPLLVLGAQGSGTIIAIIIFLLVIGGIFTCLEACGLMKYMLDKLVYKYESKRYKLVFVIAFFFMCMGSFIGSFEECVPLVPIVVALTVSLGWDAITGLGISILAAGCGFAAGVCNPFTVGVAQELAGLKMFSGVWYRLVAFFVIYACLMMFIMLHIKKIEEKNENNNIKIKTEYKANKSMDKGLLCFGVVLAIGILLVLSSSFISVIRDYTMPIIALVFLIAGVSASIISGMKLNKLGKMFLKGMGGIAPAIIMILMASSIKYILTEAGILDTLLYYATSSLKDMPTATIIIWIYLIVLATNFFIPSGSAKAFLLIPLVIPLADMFNIPRQLCVMAYAFGDGFSNVFYITNPVLLISLGVAGVGYQKWAKWSIKFQLCNLVITSLLLIAGYFFGYC